MVFLTSAPGAPINMTLLLFMCFYIFQMEQMKKDINKEDLNSLFEEEDLNSLI
jgi:hypothetical protein